MKTVKVDEVMHRIRRYSIQSEDVGYDVDQIATLDHDLMDIELAYEELEEAFKEERQWIREMYENMDKVLIRISYVLLALCVTLAVLILVLNLIRR